MSLPAVKLLFLVAGLYDLILGLGFALFYQTIYGWFAIDLPSHPAYVQLPALLSMVFGIGFLLVAADPVANRSIIFLGVLMKVVYSALILGHWLSDQVPPLYVAFAVLDVVFAVLFIMAFRSLKRPS
jgi:hypothetical protein